MADVKKVLDLEQLTYYNTALKGKIRWFGTHAQYDAIAVKDPSTIYFITDSQKIIRDGKEFGGIFNIHKRTSEPTPGFGAVGDFAIVTESSSSPYGDIYYKINAGSWTNITGARLDKENSFSFGASFGGSVDLMDGTDILRISRTKLSQSSDMFNWYDIEIPTVTANDEMALKSKTQTKIAFSTTSPTAAIGSDGDLYVQYTETSGVISDPKLYGKISGVWYLLGGGGGTMDSEWKDDSTNGLQNKIITNGVKHCYGDGSTTPTGVLPSGQKSITFGDTVPTTMNEGDIFFKHRGAGKDYVTTDDLAVTQIPVTVSSTTYTGAIHAHKYGKVVVIEFQGVRATVAGSGDIATVGAEYAPYYGDQIDSMWCSLDASKIGIVQVTNTGLIRVYNYPQDTQFWGSLTYICK